MATKDYCLPFNGQTPTTNNRRYTNLNLNRNHFEKPSFIQSPKKDMHVTPFDRRQFGTRFEQKHRPDWPNSTFNNSRTNPFNNYGGNKEEAKKQWKKSLSHDDLTFQRHVSAYENSGYFESEKSGNHKKWHNAKQVQTAPPKFVENSFEFPRQQKDTHITDSEVMQFKASQQLLNPDQTSAVSLDSMNADGSQIQQEHQQQINLSKSPIMFESENPLLTAESGSSIHSDHGNTLANSSSGSSLSTLSIVSLSAIYRDDYIPRPLPINEPATLPAGPLYDEPEPGYEVSQEWNFDIQREKPFYAVDEEVSSLSEFEDDDEVLSVQGNNAELLPCHYPEQSESSEDESDYKATWIEREAKCRTITAEMKKYWECVRKLVADRKKIITVLEWNLSKERYYTFEETVRINTKIDLIEKDLNEIIPVCPKWKATYQKDSNKNIIHRKGYIYERNGDTNQFQCTFIYDFERCCSCLYVDENDTIIEGSFCRHYHIGYAGEYVEDDPPPSETPVSFTRIIHPTVLGKRKYLKMVELIEQKSLEVNRLRCQILLCLKNLELVKRYIKELEEKKDELTISRRNQISTKIVVMEATNLLKCIRLDKLAN